MVFSDSENDYAFEDLDAKTKDNINEM